MPLPDSSVRAGSVEFTTRSIALNPVQASDEFRNGSAVRGSRGQGRPPGPGQDRRGVSAPEWGSLLPASGSSRAHRAAKDAARSSMVVPVELVADAQLCAVAQSLAATAWNRRLA